MNAWDIIGTLGISVITTVGTLWAGAKLVAGKWLESRFANRLEALKLEGQKQLEAARQEHASYTERLKFEHAGLLDRSAKLNQREFEIVPEIWKNATEAHYAIMRLISIWQESPDLTRMSNAQFEAFLASSRLQEWQKDEIRLKNNYERTTYYSEAQDWFRLQDANAALISFNRSAASGNIFLHPESHAKFDEFGNAMRKAFNRWSLNRQFRLDGDTVPKDDDDPVQRYRADGDSKYNELARYLRERYWITPEGQAV